MPIIPIACNIIYKAVAEVDLIVLEARFWNIEDYLILSVTDAKVCTHLAWVTAHAGGGELDAG